MSKIQRQLTTLLLGVSLLTQTGCYAMTVQAADLDKPVSVSHSTGEGGRVKRTFRHEMVSWYLLGLLPVATIPGGAGASSNADSITADVVRAELQQGGNGIADLKVTHEYSVISALLNMVTGMFLGGLVRSVGVTVEGNVVD